MMMVMIVVIVLMVKIIGKNSLPQHEVSQKSFKILVDIQKSVIISLREGIELAVQNSYWGEHGMGYQQVIAPKKVGLLNLVMLVINVNNR